MTNQSLQTLCQSAIALGLIIAGIAGFGSYFFSQRIKKEDAREIENKQKVESDLRARTGVLNAESEKTDNSEPIHPKIELGNSGANLIYVGKKGAPVFEFGKGDFLTVEQIDNSIKLSTKLRDENGKIVAEIVKNEWKVNPNNIWDRNYTNDALEIKDPDGDIILQIKILADRIQFQAKLYDSSGRRIGIGNSDESQGGMIEITGEAHPELKLNIKPLFVYPSELHLGEYVDTET